MLKGGAIKKTLPATVSGTVYLQYTYGIATVKMIRLTALTVSTRLP